MDAVGRSLLILGAVLVVTGGLVLLGSRAPFLGRLPGDILFQRSSFSFYFPLVTAVLLSVLLTVLANVVIRLLGR